jgi:hypothetical protein
MHRFIEMNPGLKSRFDKTFQFYDYSAEQLLQITDVLLKKEGLTMSPEAKEHLNKYFTTLYEKRDKFFGNARTVRQTVGEVVMKQNLRLASIPSAQRTPEALGSLTFDDVKHLHTEEGKVQQGLGFRFGGASA